MAVLEKITPYIGWAGFACGLFTAIAAVQPGIWQFAALISMMPGFLFSSLYILLSNRYQLRSGWINPGYTGMLLNSVPLILILYFQFNR